MKYIPNILLKGVGVGGIQSLGQCLIFSKQERRVAIAQVNNNCLFFNFAFSRSLASNNSYPSCHQCANNNSH